MKIKLSDHFNYKKLLQATLPSILMMVFTSIYGIVDGVFISNYVGTTAFSAVNYFIPVTMVIGAIGFMMGAGGSALVAKTLGEGDEEKANRIFTTVVCFTAVMGAAISVIVFFLVEPIAKLIGADSAFMPYIKTYGKILIAAEVAFMLQNLFQSFFIAAEKATLGFIVTVIAGVTNMILDALFMAVFDWGVKGAAVATIISQMIGAIIPLCYFFNKNNTSLLRFTKPKFEFSVLFKSCTNGSSELLSNVSASVVSMLYNNRLLKIAGQTGVGAYGIIMYVGFIFAAIFLGYAVGTAPIISYHYGAKNTDELKNVLRKSLVINFVGGAIMTGVAIVLSYPLSYVFAKNDSALLKMTNHAMKIYSFSFIVMGFNIFASSFFTALNNGLVSALISGIRTLIFQTSSVILFAKWFGLNGVWSSVIAAEAVALILGVIFFITNRKKYGY